MRTNSFVGIFLCLGLCILMSYNLFLAFDDYALERVSINQFFFMQSKHQFTTGGKVTNNQAYRENFVSDKMNSVDETDMVSKLGNRKFYLVHHEINYVKIIEAPKN